MKHIQTLSLLAVSLLILGGCSVKGNNSTNGNGDESDTHIVLPSKEHIDSLNISMEDGFSAIYATQTKKVLVTSNPSKNIQVTWCFEKGKNNASFEGNEITVGRDAPNESQIIFYAKYNSIESNKITLIVENLDEEISSCQEQIDALESQREEVQSNYDEAKQGYDEAMSEYNSLLEYCERMGWCNGREFDPTKKDEWYDTKQEMSSYYERAKSYDTEMSRYENELNYINSQIRDLKTKMQELKRIKASL